MGVRIMAGLDFFSISSVIGAVALINAIAMFVVWRINPKVPGLCAWTLAQIFTVIAWTMSIMVIQGVISGAIYTVVNNTLTLTSLIALLEGVLRFRAVGNPQRRRFWIALGIALAACLAFINHDHTVRRYLFHDFAVIVLLSAAAWYMIRGTSSDERIVQGMTAAFFLTMAACFAGRWSMAALHDPATPFSTQTVNPPLFTAIVLCSMGWVYGLMLSVNVRAQQQVLRMSRIDPLTQLANRRQLEHILGVALARIGRTGRLFGIAFFDLDGFKSVNDQHGHAGGDYILTVVADRLRAFLRNSDESARIGGDEFVVVFDNLGSQADLDCAASRLRAAIEGPVALSGTIVPLGISLGTALAPVDGDNIDTLLCRADVRMYIDKRLRKSPGPRPRVTSAEIYDLNEKGRPKGAARL